MYTPRHFQQHDKATISAFLKDNSFGILVSQVDSHLWATHIPMLLSSDGTKLTGHVSKGNKQWRGFNEGSEVLAIFNGPHAYVSSSWYSHKNVPTWNYIAVHVYGTIRQQNDMELYESLKQLVDTYEKHTEKPVAVETMSPAFLEREMRGVVGFEITITKIEATHKLSQNRSRQDFDSVVDHLEHRDDSQSKAVAAEMKKQYPA